MCVCVSEPTIITTQPSTLDVTVGESVVLPCQVSHDPSLELKFTWFFNEQLIHFGNHGGFFEKVGGVSAGIHTDVFDFTVTFSVLRSSATAQYSSFQMKHYIFGSSNELINWSNI